MPTILRQFFRVLGGVPRSGVDSRDSSSSPRIPHVLCLGGGYVAINLAKALRRHLRAGRVRLTVVDRDNFQYFHGLVPEMLVGKLQPLDPLSPSRRLFAPGDFVNAEVEQLELDKKQVIVSRFIDGRRLTLDYDHIVLALGTTETLGRFPGLAEHSFRLKAYSGCLALRNHLISMLELADMERDPAERRRLLTFVVAGANYAGVEVAGELREFLPDTARRYFRHILPHEISVVLVCSTDHILPELRSRMPGLVQYAERTLADDPHLKVLYGRKIAAATIDEALLSDGTRIPTRTIVSCTGMSVVPVLDSVNLQKDAHGRLVADCYGHAAGKTDIWTGGDCGAVPQPDGSPAPPLAIWAITVGKLIGKNIMRQIDGARLMPYRFSGLGDACVFGHRHAIASLKGIPLRGRLAWLIWRLFMVSYLPSPEKKLRVLGNWLTAPFFGRDLISMRVQQPLDLRPMIFEDGQDIIREGDVGNSLFIIQQGEVDVIKDDHGVERHLATLGQGQHFGEIAVFQACPRTATVRARGHVRVLQMRREAALALSGSLAAVGASLKPLPKGSHKP